MLPDKKLHVCVVRDQFGSVSLVLVELAHNRLPEPQRSRAADWLHLPLSKDVTPGRECVVCFSEWRCGGPFGRRLVLVLHQQRLEAGVVAEGVPHGIDSEHRHGGG